MLSVEQARNNILAMLTPLGSEFVPLGEALGRVLAKDVVARESIPPFANSSMDGYAVRAEETGRVPVRLPVAGDVPAGSAPGQVLPPGHVLRIMTGAPIPQGADAVVPVEATDDQRNSNALPAQVTILAAPETGANIRPAGQDVAPGQTVVRVGQVITPPVIGVLAALGVSRPQVARRPRVAVLSGGDELVEVEQVPGPGQIRDLNGYALSASLTSAGAVPVRLGIARDRLEAVRAQLQRAVGQGVDLVLSSAGVSVGGHDFIKSALDAEGELGFWRVNMRPGKPLAVGRVRGIPFIGLPGNPVSALVGFEAFVRPAVARMLGQTWSPRAIQVAAGHAMSTDGRESYVRVTLRDGRAYSTGAQTSNLITSLVRADALLIIPAGVKAVAAGEALTAWLLN
jgi:molybdopterin molybdotransferase